MALTFTITGLQAELDAFATALKARDWDTALDEYNDYRLTYAGLFASGSVDGLSLTLPKPSELAEALEDSRATAGQLSSAGRGRFAVARTNFPGRAVL